MSPVVGVILGIDAVADNKYLYVLEQACIYPEGMALVTVYLIKSFFKFQAYTFKLNLYKGNTINQQGDIIAVFIDALDSLLVFPKEFLEACKDQTFHQKLQGVEPTYKKEIQDKAGKEAKKLAGKIKELTRLKKEYEKLLK